MNSCSGSQNGSTYSGKWVKPSGVRKRARFMTDRLIIPTKNDPCLSYNDGGKLPQINTF